MDIKLIKFDREVSFYEEAYKLDEELVELLNSLIASDSENFYEEFFDVIQVILQLADIKGIPLTNKLLLEELKKHNNKLEERGWNMKCLPKK